MALIKSKLLFNSSTSFIIDVFRNIFCIGVLLSHTFQIFASTLASPKEMANFLYESSFSFILNMSMISVWGMFLISGFILMNQYLNNVHTGWSGIMHRWKRLFPLFFLSNFIVIFGGNMMGYFDSINFFQIFPLLMVPYYFDGGSIHSTIPLLANILSWSVMIDFSIHILFHVSFKFIKSVDNRKLAIIIAIPIAIIIRYLMVDVDSSVISVDCGHLAVFNDNEWNMFTNITNSPIQRYVADPICMKFMVNNWGNLFMSLFPFVLGALLSFIKIKFNWFLQIIGWIIFIGPIFMLPEPTEDMSFQMRNIMPLLFVFAPIIQIIGFGIVFHSLINRKFSILFRSSEIIRYMGSLTYSISLFQLLITYSVIRITAFGSLTLLNLLIISTFTYIISILLAMINQLIF